MVVEVNERDRLRPDKQEKEEEKMNENATGWQVVLSPGSNERRE
jgi:hypothetical protein